MTTFVDTSALYALLDEDDRNHQEAAQTLARLRGTELMSHAYVVVESLALVTRRLGWAAVEKLIDEMLPVVSVLTVDQATHSNALAAYRDAGSTRVSFVDQTSFTIMRAQGIDEAFAFDEDLETGGFRTAGLGLSGP